MNKPKKIRTFVISTKGLLGSRRILEHVKNIIQNTELNKSDAEKIYVDLERQIDKKNR